MKQPPPRSFTYAIFRAVFDSRSSFFAPKPHGNACYAGYFSVWKSYRCLGENDEFLSRYYKQTVGEKEKLLSSLPWFSSRGKEAGLRDV